MLDLHVFHPNALNDIRLLDECFQPVSQFALLLDPRSMLITAEDGCGRFTLMKKAERVLTEDKWLCVRLDARNIKVADESDVMGVLFSAVTQRMWEQIQEDPERLVGIGSRATPLRFFLNRLWRPDLAKNLLTSLSEDHPAFAQAIQRIVEDDVPADFLDSASIEQRIDVLCGCAQKLGNQGIVVWLNIEPDMPSTETLLGIARHIFDSPQLVRMRAIHFKGVVTESQLKQLSRLQGPNTLSVDIIKIRWSQDDLLGMLTRRFHTASQKKVTDLKQVIEVESFLAFVGTELEAMPDAWLRLAEYMAQEISQTSILLLDRTRWDKVRLRYCQAHIKIALDEDKVFWRGKIKVLNQRKAALHFFLLYLYERPEFHTIKSLGGVLNLADSDVNVYVHRIRKEIEPIPNKPIYLVSDSGGSFALKNTVKLMADSPQ